MRWAQWHLGALLPACRGRGRSESDPPKAASRPWVIQPSTLWPPPKKNLPGSSGIPLAHAQLFALVIHKVPRAFPGEQRREGGVEHLGVQQHSTPAPTPAPARRDSQWLGARVFICPRRSHMQERGQVTTGKPPNPSPKSASKVSATRERGGAAPGPSTPSQREERPPGGWWEPHRPLDRPSSGASRRRR